MAEERLVLTLSAETFTFFIDFDGRVRASVEEFLPQRLVLLIHFLQFKIVKPNASAIILTNIER